MNRTTPSALIQEYLYVVQKYHFEDDLTEREEDELLDKADEIWYSMSPDERSEASRTWKQVREEALDNVTI